MQQLHLYSVLTLLTILIGCVRAFPVLDSGDDADSKTEVQSDANVIDNLVQSVENGGNEGRDDEHADYKLMLKSEEVHPSNNKRSFWKDLKRVEEKQPFAKFYRPETRSVNPSVEDGIIFPSASSNIETYSTYNRGFSDRYNKHRPNIPTPQVGIPFNFAIPLPFPSAIGAGASSNINSYSNRSPQLQTQYSNTNDSFLTTEQNVLLYQTLVQLFQGLFSSSGQRNTNNSNNNNNYNRLLWDGQPSNRRPSSRNNDPPTPGLEAVEEVDGVNYQSLYSGPRVQKSPCPQGMHRTHGGGCHEKAPRKLLNSNG